MSREPRFGHPGNITHLPAGLINAGTVLYQCGSPIPGTDTLKAAAQSAYNHDGREDKLSVPSPYPSASPVLLLFQQRRIKA